MVEDDYLDYMLEIEGMELLIERLKMEQENLPDSWSDDSQSIDNTPDFESNAYVSKEVEIGVKIRDLERKLGTAKKRFQFIYGDDL